MSGTIVPYRKTSLIMQFKYGRFSLSSMVGSRLVPTILSISSWALRCISGWRAIISQNSRIALTVCAGEQTKDG